MNGVQANTRMIYYHPDDLAPLWKLTARKLIELVIQTVVPLGIVLASYALLPAVLCPFLLPVIAITAAFTSAFIFAPSTDPVEAVAFDKIFPSALPPIELAPHVPRGIRNAGSNCWANSLAQILRCDKSFMTWIKSTPENLNVADNANGLYWASFLPTHLLFPAEDLAGAQTIELPMIPMIAPLPLRGFQTAAQLADRIKVTVAPLPAAEAPAAGAAVDPAKLAIRAALERNHAEQSAFLGKCGNALRPDDLTDAEKALIGTKKEIPFETLTDELKAKLRRQGEVKLADLGPQERIRYLTGLNRAVLNWAIKIPEAQLLREEMIFPAQEEALNLPADLAPGPREERMLEAICRSIDARYLDQFPAENRASRIQYVAKLIRELRKLAEKNQMSAAEKHGLFLSLSQLGSAQSIFRKFIGHRSGIHLPFDLAFGADMPVDLPAPFLDQFPGDDRVQFTAEVLAHIQELRNDLVAANLPADIGDVMRDWMSTYQKVRSTAAPERKELLRYINVIQTAEASKRGGVINALVAFRNFFNGYDLTIRANRRIALGNSQNLRVAISSLNDMIDERASAEEDPSEGLMVLDYLLPPELKVKLQTSKEIRGHPTLVKTESSFGLLPVEIIGVQPNVEALVQRFFNKPAHGDEIQINGVNYQGIAEKAQFETAPDTLRIQLKRFTNVRPFSILHALMPFWFGPAKLQTEKLKNEVILSDFLNIQLADGTDVRYKLESFIVHQGDTPRSGHYVAYKRETKPDGSEIWYKISDSIVSEISGAELEKAKGEVYIPHYTKI